MTGRRETTNSGTWWLKESREDRSGEGRWEQIIAREDFAVLIFYCRLSEAARRCGEEVWCVIYTFERSFCLMSGNEIVGRTRIEREGQVAGIDRSQANDEGALLCVCVLYCIA